MLQNLLPSSRVHKKRAFNSQIQSLIYCANTSWNLFVLFEHLSRKNIAFFFYLLTFCWDCRFKIKIL